MEGKAPIVSMIAAMAENRVIGRHNRLPWHLPADLQHFKALTLGKPIVMGRKTWESLPGLLPGRRHVVITRNQGYRADGAEVVHSLQAALALLSDVAEIMIVGGANIYQQAIGLADCIYLTVVHQNVEGDAFFPIIDPSLWEKVSEQRLAPDERNPMPYSFCLWRRRIAANT